LKVDGLVSPVGAEALDAAAMRAVMERLLPVRERTAFTEIGEANLSHVHPILGRFRVNCYRAMGVSGAVLRRGGNGVPPHCAGAPSSSARGSSWWWGPRAPGSRQPWPP